MTTNKTSILLSDVSIEGDLIEKDRIIFDAKIRGDIKADEIGATRPTAVNLMWAVKQMKEKAANFSGDVADLKIALLDLANEIRDDDIDRCHNLGLHGAKLIPDQAKNLADAIKIEPRLKERIDQDQEIATLVETASQLEG